MKDLHLYDETRYEKLYTWLYFSQAFHRYMYKTCEVFYGKTLCQVEKGEDLGHIRGSLLKITLVKSYEDMQIQNLIKML